MPNRLATSTTGSGPPGPLITLLRDPCPLPISSGCAKYEFEEREVCVSSAASRERGREHRGSLTIPWCWSAAAGCVAIANAILRWGQHDRIGHRVAAKRRNV